MSVQGYTNHLHNCVHRCTLHYGFKYTHNRGFIHYYEVKKIYNSAFESLWDKHLTPLNPSDPFTISRKVTHFSLDLVKLRGLFTGHGKTIKDNILVCIPACFTTQIE